MSPAEYQIRLALPACHGCDHGVSLSFRPPCRHPTQLHTICSNRAAFVPIRVLSSAATEQPELSAQHPRVTILRHNVEDGALALIICRRVLSFHDARPRGNSHLDFAEQDGMDSGGPV
jgi:hypothetical protein